MSDALHLVESKLDNLLTALETLKKENTVLRRENRALKTELGNLRDRSEKVRLMSGDRQDSMKLKLETVMSHIDELERLII
ncbi:MAG: hypothetical protein SGI97_03020 [candidate division Zixibacteria bacterium]|nr:hypothetical protein [candidate division Zixibacteria bacterium]